MIISIFHNRWIFLRPNYLVVYKKGKLIKREKGVTLGEKNNKKINFPSTIIQ